MVCDAGFGDYSFELFDLTALIMKDITNNIIFLFNILYLIDQTF